MPPAFSTWLQEIMRTARETYGVNPVIFLIVYLGCAPLWYFSLFRILRAAVQKRTKEMLPWSMLFLTTTVAPFIYVILFGRNLPWWVYAVIAVLVLQSAWALYRKLRPRASEPQASLAHPGATRRQD